MLGDAARASVASETTREEERGESEEENVRVIRSFVQSFQLSESE